MADDARHEPENPGDLGDKQTSDASSDNSGTITNFIYRIALAWLKIGANPIPAAEDGSKRPMPGTPGAPDAYNWHQYANDIRPSGADLYGWYIEEGRQSLGLAMGPSSLIQLTCLDFEEAARIEIFDEIKQLRLRDSRLNEIMQRISDGYLEQTAGHGWHILYSCDCEIYHGSEKLIREPEVDAAGNAVIGADGRQGVTLLLETKANGGFIILAPSNGLTHATGKPWVQKQGGPETLAHLSQADCEYLRGTLGSLDRMPIAGASEAFTETTASSATLLGDRFNEKEEWKNILTKEHGYVPFPDHTGKQKVDRNKWTYWTCQAKVDRAKDLGQPASPSCSTGFRPKKGKDLLVVFGGEHPCGFKPGESYSKFRAYTYLNFGTTNEAFHAAALSLKDRYGDKERSFSYKDAGQTAPADPGPTTTSSWAGEELDFDTPAPIPSILQRTDGVSLVYPNMRNVFFGPPEAAKSWLLVFMIVQVIEVTELTDPGGKDKIVVIIDHEDTNGIWGRRLLQLGLSKEVAIRRIKYVGPQEAPKKGEISRELGPALETAKLIGIDSMNESMYLLVLDPLNNADIGKWRNQYLTPLENASDAAIVVIDHVGHNNPSERLAALGGVTKLSGVRGSQIKFEVVDQPAPGRTGRMRLICTKDPNGSVRAKGIYLGERRHNMGLFVMEPVAGTSPEKLRCAIHPAKAASSRWTADIIKAIRKWEAQAATMGVDLAINQFGQGNGASKRELITELRAMGVKGDDKLMRAEIDRASEDGHIRCLVKSGTNVYRTIQTFDDAPF